MITIVIPSNINLAAEADGLINTIKDNPDVLEDKVFRKKCRDLLDEILDYKESIIQPRLDPYIRKPEMLSEHNNTIEFTIVFDKDLEDRIRELMRV